MPNQISDDQLGQLREEIKAGRKLTATKLYMRISGSTLPEARIFIQQVIIELGDEAPETPEENLMGCSAVWLLIVVLSASAAYTLGGSS